MVQSIIQALDKIFFGNQPNSLIELRRKAAEESRRLFPEYYVMHDHPDRDDHSDASYSWQSDEEYWEDYCRGFDED